MVFAELHPSASLEGLLLMGGRSSRFQPDKMQVSLDGVPLYIHALRVLAGLCPHVWVATGRDGVQEVPVVSGPARISLVPDDRAGLGPLEGIRSVMARTGASHLLVLAGDLPRIRAATLNRLLEAPLADVVCARDGSSGRLQPLCGLWSTSLLPSLTQSLTDGHRGVQHFLAQQNVRTIDVPTDELLNVNRPSDLPGSVAS